MGIEEERSEMKGWGGGWGAVVGHYSNDNKHTNESLHIAGGGTNMQGPIGIAPTRVSIDGEGGGGRVGVTRGGQK